MKTPCLVWFRHDLRLADQPALAHAVSTGKPVIPVFIWAPEEEGPWPLGGASQWWLHHSLNRLSESLRASGSRLILRRGASQTVLKQLLRETGADAVFWNRRYEPAILQRDNLIQKSLAEKGIEIACFNGSLLLEPWTLATAEGRPYQVFTPFWNACSARLTSSPLLPAPGRVLSPAHWPSSLPVEALHWLPRLFWADSFPAHWTPGEEGARAALSRFLKRMEFYSAERDLPAETGTSRLSPHLHFGEISVRTVWNRLQKAGAGRAALAKSIATYRKELGWREFAHHLIFHFPHTPQQPLRAAFQSFPWKKDASALKKWQRGQTGFPIVDAGMRELAVSGWMHNRVRMVVASFLVKDLMVDWREGARWFWDRLVDADLANNTLGWQWSAGCGADAAPYFRVFNPLLQGETFDADGHYVRRWVPELSRLPHQWIHKPWQASEAERQQAGIDLGKTYPHPMVDHGRARLEALERFQKIKASRKPVSADHRFR